MPANGEAKKMALDERHFLIFVLVEKEVLL